MSLIVETGQGLANAESYASVADADAYANSLGNPNGWSNRPAENTLLLSLQPFDGHTVLIDAKTYTFKAALTGADGEILIGADVAATLTSLMKALGLDGVGGVDYDATTTEHPSVAADPAFDGRVVARAVGAAANAIITTLVSSPENEWESGGTLVGGTVRLTTRAKEDALRRATQYLDGRWGPRFRGSKVDLDQRLEWPRVGAHDDAGWEFTSDEIPEPLIRALAELAIALFDAGSPELAPNVTDEAPILRERSKVGPLETDITFGEGGNSPGRRDLQRAEHLLRELVWAAGEIRRA